MLSWSLAAIALIAGAVAMVVEGFLTRSIAGAIAVGAVAALAFVLAQDAVTRFARRLPLLLAGLFMVYSVLGIMPLTSYRALEGPWFWLASAAAFSAMFLTGAWLGSRLPSPEPLVTVRRVEAEAYAFGHLALCLAVAVGIFLRHGLTLFNPQERFAVDGGMQLIVESGIIPLLVIWHSRGAGHWLSWACFAAFAATQMVTGFRNPIALAVFALLLLPLLDGGSLSLRRQWMLALVIVIAFPAQVLLLDLRHSQSPDLMPLADKVVENELVQPTFGIALMPLHLYAREGLGVSEVAIDRSDELYAERGPFQAWMMDIATMLPGKRQTFGTLLGEVVNRNDDSTLTLSLPGAMQVCFGWAGIVVFSLMLGFANGFAYMTWRTRGHGLLPLILLTVYTMMFYIRGFPKPFYLVIAVLAVAGPFIALEYERRDKAPAPGGGA